MRRQQFLDTFQLIFFSFLYLKDSLFTLLEGIYVQCYVVIRLKKKATLKENRQLTILLCFSRELLVKSSRKISIKFQEAGSSLKITLDGTLHPSARQKM